MQKRWIRSSYDQEDAEHLHEKLKIHPILCALLAQRGISNYEEAHRFFRPQLDQLHDPFLMKDMEAAVTRIIHAIENGEKIMIYGDYDVDGTTSVALVYSFLIEFHSQLEFYIPDRYKEGYGISRLGVEQAQKSGCSMIIALDCGIKAVDKIEYANQLGIDCIICDHHRPGEVLPPAIAVLDPKRKDCPYPYKELSGCGIGFKLLQALAIRLDIPDEVVLKHLDLVVISIGSDIVPITGENRILAFYGLRTINSHPRKSIKALLNAAKVKKNLSISDIVFTLGPRINAAGRIKSGKNAVKLLISEDDQVIEEMVEVLQDNNRERRALDKHITEQALQYLEWDAAHKERYSTVVFDPSWHKGVIGIVAARLIEVYYRPTIVFTKSNGYLTGSARSIKGFDIYEAIAQCSDLLEGFGGHTYAAGLSMKEENYLQFKERFELLASQNIDRDHLIPQITFDAELDFDQVNGKFFRILEQFAPFGPENRRPVFVTRDAKALERTRVVGKVHLKLTAQQGSRQLNGIAFNMGDRIQSVQSGKFDVCYCIDENVWNGKSNLEMYIKDFKTEKV